MGKTYDYELQIALEAVLKACDLAKKMQGKLEALDVVGKEDLSPVTITDFSCQALINMHLLSHFPGTHIMGEEDSLFLRQPQNQLIKSKVIEQLQGVYPSIKEGEILDAIDYGGWEGGGDSSFWVLDPIDGTRGFIRNEQYAIALALIEKGKVMLGVLGCPRLLYGQKKGGIFTAVKGQGTQLHFFDSSSVEVMRVAPLQEPEEVIYCETQDPSKARSALFASKITKELGARPHPFPLDSQCKYAQVATQETSIYLRVPVSPTHREKIWDHAPGLIIVEEAGGKVTDLEGKELDFSLGKTLSTNRGLIVSNGILHDRAVRAAQKVLNAEPRSDLFHHVD